MNRKLKFRVWTGTQLVYSEDSSEVRDSYKLSEFFELYGDSGKITQYIGIQDSSGKDIYEGDILEEWVCNGTRRCLGECREVLMGWRIFSYPRGNAYHGWKERVIGNIFENPELLKNKNLTTDE
jgi:hypothetical protein